MTLDTNTQEITYDFRDLDGAVLRTYTLTGSGAAETWSNWKHEKDFVYGPEGLLGSVTRTGNRFFSHKDHLGTPRAISDVAGVLQGRHDYYPFGHEVGRFGQVDEEMVKFTGHQRDAHGLSDYMLGRTCLWPLRRFASVDAGRDGWNLYAYGGNNPIKFIDPDGREISYASQKDRIFYENAAARNSRVRRVLAAFGPGTNRDLVVERGDPGSHQSGFRRAAVANVTIGREASQAAMISAFEAAGGGDAGTAAAEAVYEAASNDVTRAVITLGNGASDVNRLHELGHVEQALLHPQDFLKQAEEAGRAQTIDDYHQSLSEDYANDFAAGIKNRDPRQR